MSIIVFAGPSIRKEKVLELLPNADVRPPAKQGDLFLATRDQPKIILLIDGFFESVPAVWHKEILYAMSIGIHVYGSSSMGALRAAELHMFGMVGVGHIFEKFASGAWQDDDEVALTHGPQALGYLATSRAMADLRHDLTLACEHKLLSASQAKHLEAQLKALWYPHRSHHSLCDLAKEVLNEEQVAALALFLKQSPSVKEEDAKQLLKQVAQIDLTSLTAKTIDYVLQENDAWQTLINDVARTRATHIQVDLPTSVATQDSTEHELFNAKLRARALEHAESLGVAFKPWVRLAFEKVVSQWGCVSNHGQIEFAKVSAKLVALSLTTAQFDQWIEREAMLMAYAYQIDIQPEHVMDEQLIRKGLESESTPSMTDVS